MPQRFLRPGITNSDRFNGVSFEAQSLFLRMLTVVDDFGRYDGRPSVLHGSLFAVWNDQNPKKAIDCKQTAALCEELSHKGLVKFYKTEGKTVAQIEQWSEKPRAEKSKYPNCEQTAALCYQDENNPPPPSIPVPRSDDHIPSFLVPADAGALLRSKFEEWMVVRKGQGKKPKDWGKMFAEQWEWLQQFGESGAVQVISQSIRNGWTGLFAPNGSKPPPPKNRGGAGLTQQQLSNLPIETFTED